MTLIGETGNITNENSLTVDEIDLTTATDSAVEKPWNNVQTLNEIFGDKKSDDEDQGDIEGGGDEIYQAVKYLQNNPLPNSEKSDDVNPNVLCPTPPKKKQYISIAQTLQKQQADDNSDMENTLYQLNKEIRAGNHTNAKMIFKKWEKRKKQNKSKTIKCPFCGIEKTNLKTHCMRVHEMSEENAKALRSNIGLSHVDRKVKNVNERKGKLRFYARRLCPVTGCSKTPVRMENHLKDTHKIKDIKIYRRYLKEAEVIPQYNTESDASTNESDDSQDERQKIEKLIDINKSANPIDNDEESDPDWLEEFGRKVRRRKRESRVRNEVPHEQENCKEGRIKFVSGQNVHEFNLGQNEKVVESNIESDEECTELQANIKFAKTMEVVNNVTTIDTGGARSDVQCEEKNEGDDPDEEDYSVEEAEDDESLALVVTPWKSSPLFDQFLHWLTSPDARAKPLRQAQQHVRQVIIILRDSGNDTYELASLFDRKKIRDYWLISFETKCKSGTVKSYISSLRMFYHFVIAEDPTECESYRDKCEALVITTTNWISVYRKKVKKCRWERDMVQLTQLFTSSEIKQFDNSELVSYCKSTLRSFRCQENQPTLRQFTNARDFILMSLCLDNASRTGSLANMTLKEFERGVVSNGCYRINVLEHKTVSTSGPACIVATAELYKQMLTYVNMRNKLEGMNNETGDNYVFISWSGSRMSSSMVTAQLNSFWGKAVGHTQERPRVSAALVRKSAVSKVHEHHKDKCKDLANLMCHSEETAKRVYYLQEKSKRAVETSSTLRSVLREPDSSENLRDSILKHFGEDIEKRKITLAIVKEKKNACSAFKDILDLTLRDKIRYMISQKSQCDQDNTDIESDDENDETTKLARDGYPGKRKDRVVFSEHDNKDIYVHFGVLIKASAEERVKVSRFKRILKQEVLKPLLKRHGEQTLLSKVRTERKKFLLKK